MVALGGSGRVRWEGVGAGEGCRDEGLVVVRSGWSARLVYVAGALEDVVGSRPVSSLLEPVRDRLVVFEGVIEVRPHSHFYQPIVDSFFGVVPPSPVSAQFYV